MNPLGGNMDAD